MNKSKIGQICRKFLTFLVLAVTLTLLVVIATTDGASAKYIKDIGNTNAVIRAKEFYFSSDLLKENGESYTLNPGTDSITFELRNHDDQLRYSENPVQYTVAVTGGATVSSASGSLEGNKISSSTITVSDLVNGQAYTITVTGNAGYEKQLSATFTVRQPESGVYKYLESDPSGAFVLLTVWTKNSSGNVTISIPAGLIPDATDNALTGIQNYNAGTKTYSAVTSQSVGTLGIYSSHTYRFFLETPFTQYSANSFSVTVGNTTATEKTPY